MNEVSLKPVIEELENLFSKFNARFFADKLEKPVITVSPDHTRGAYGWCTGWKAWKAGEDEGHYNAKDDRMGNNPNQMNIQSMYSDIDLDANGMETEFQAAFDDLLWFINQDFANTGRGDFEEEETTIVFNRDMPVNESEAIENCGKSVGILSNETIVAQHPWTTDVELELERIRKEKEEAMEQAQDYTGAFGNVQKEDPDGDEGGDE